MRRFMALLSAGVLVASLAASSVAAAPQRGMPNSFTGDFDMIAWDGTVVAHVLASFREPSDKKLVPGMVDIYWASGDVRESHAQILKTYFWDWNPADDPDEGNQTYARVVGSLCDYIGPQAGSCQSFAMVFVDTLNPAFRNHVGFSEPGSTVCCDGQWYDAGRGSFALNYSSPTPENTLPEGTHDGSTWDVVPAANSEYCYANGWANDPDQVGVPLRVRIFADGQVVWLGLGNNDPRPDAPGGNGFWVNLVGLIAPDIQHEIRVQAQDLTTHEWANLTDTPRTLTCLSS